MAKAPLIKTWSQIWLPTAPMINNHNNVESQVDMASSDFPQQHLSLLIINLTTPCILTFPEVLLHSIRNHNIMVPVYLTINRYTMKSL